jgi:hypothetical protein
MDRQQPYMGVEFFFEWMRDVQMNMESQPLVTSALVEVQDFRKKNHSF